MRDLLVGLTVVRADGTVVKGGGRVVKNVTGYDIPKLHVGALGTLGVVVEAHLRLHSRPIEERSWVFGFASVEAALHAALDIRDTPVVLSRCQLVTTGALRALGEPEPPAAALAVTIGSVPQAVHAQGSQVADICSRAGSPAIEVPQADAWWQRIADVTWPEGPATHLSMRIGIRRPMRQGAPAWSVQPAARLGPPSTWPRCPPRHAGPHRGSPRQRRRRACPRGPREPRRHLRRGARSAGRPAGPRCLG
jgi:FAD/FMN-containing dehydrogenase